MKGEAVPERSEDTDASPWRYEVLRVMKPFAASENKKKKVPVSKDLRVVAGAGFEPTTSGL